jgi:hypothetical protein
MRTKTILLSAILGAISGVSLMAQVYSLNAVGYINIVTPPGFSIIANQLNTTNNNISPLLDSQLGDGNHDGVRIYKYANGTYSYLQADSFNSPPWDGDAAHTSMNPGEAVFFLNNTGAPLTLTFVGTVSQGNLTNSLPSGFSLISSLVPQAGALDTDLGLTEVDGDRVYQYDNGAGNYFYSQGDSFNTPPWDVAPGKPLSPTVAVGEGFFYLAGSAESWVRNFSVN